jgi:coenzyme F420 hydrogenase subunit beta
MAVGLKSLLAVMQIQQLSDVVDWRLCLGCGACAHICPENRVQLFDFPAEGIRPVVAPGDCGSCRLCLEVCPAVQSDYRINGYDSGEATVGPSVSSEWGPILGLWEGYATDPEIRFQGSSGGVLTAVAAYCLEVPGMHGVLHIGQDPDDPIRNRTRLSRSRNELLAAAGSRYSPASVCNGLGLVEAAPAACAVIGKPAEIAAVRNARKMRPELDGKVGLTLSFFCAESPSTSGTAALLRKLGVDPASLSNLRYRGLGWPGHFAPTRRGAPNPCHQIPYRESWAFLQAFRPWSVQLWPDSTGELADITCGDPWYEEPDGKNPGFSLVVVRTERGREIVRGAMAAGYLTLQPAEHWKLVKSQSGLVAKKGSVWGRRLALRLFGLPVTRFEGLSLWPMWKSLPLRDKLRSTLGTVRRILSRKLYRRLNLDPFGSTPIGKPVTGKSTMEARDEGLCRSSVLNPSHGNHV